jgi:glycolate oxidase FAD binding subunit
MQQTLVLDGLSPRTAVLAMSKALGSQASVAAAAHQPSPGLTALRLEGFAPSVAARRTLLADLFADVGPLRLLDDGAADALWQGFRRIDVLGDMPVLWRVIVPAARAPDLIERLEMTGARWSMDWAGGLLWVGSQDGGAIRATVETAGGHAELVRASAELRAQIPARHPASRGVAALEARVRRAFDPDGVFETGRFGD